MLWKLQLSFVAALAVIGVDGLRFGTDPVTLESGILVVGRPTRLTCNYVKFRTETVREISWYAGYNGINTKIFQYQVTAGTKEGSTFSFIKTDEASATDSELTITLPEYRAPFLTLGCEVEVLRDSGYGKLKTAKKLEESNVTVVNSQQHQLIVRAASDFGTSSQNSDVYAAIGQPFQIKCMSFGVDPAPELTLHLNGEPWEQNHPGQMLENPQDIGTMYNGHTAMKSITGRLSQVTENMFIGYGTKVINVECLAKFGEHVFDSRKVIVKRADSVAQVGAYSGSASIAGSGYSANPYSPPGPGSSDPYSSAGNPYLRDPSRTGTGSNPYLSESGSDDDQYLAPEIGSGRTERRPHYDAHRNPALGFGGNERQGRVYNNDEIHSRLLDLVDPARHNHPGIPYDFHSGYIIMISDHMDEADQPLESSQRYGSSSAASTSTTTVLGRLPDYVISAFQSNYGRYNQISNERYRFKMEPVEVLNTLGGFGYRVVDSTISAKNGKMIWTLEHKKFDIESGSGSLRGRDL